MVDGGEVVQVVLFDLGQVARPDLGPESVLV